MHKSIWWFLILVFVRLQIPGYLPVLGGLFTLAILGVVVWALSVFVTWAFRRTQEW